MEDWLKTQSKSSTFEFLHCFCAHLYIQSILEKNNHFPQDDKNAENLQNCENFERTIWCCPWSHSTSSVLFKNWYPVTLCEGNCNFSLNIWPILSLSAECYVLKNSWLQIIFLKASKRKLLSKNRFPSSDLLETVDYRCIDLTNTEF